MVSATRRDGPVPTPSARPSTTTSTWNCFSWSGPVESTTWYSGRDPVRRWVNSWSRLFGLFSVETGASIAISVAARSVSQVRVASNPSSR